MGIGFQAVIQHNHLQDVQKLALIFVDAFDLAIEDRIRINFVSGFVLEPVSEASFGGAFGLTELLAEAGIGSVLNFAPISLPSSAHCRVKNLDLRIHLEELAFLLRGTPA